MYDESKCHVLQLEEEQRQIQNVGSEDFLEITHKVISALKVRKRNKGARCDGLLSDMLKEGDTIIADELKDKSNPEAEIIIIHKKGDIAKLDN